MPKYNDLNLNVTSSAGLCNALPSPANGNVTWFGLTSGSEAIYTCDSGYQLTGYDYRICLDTGMWSGQAPNCTRMKNGFFVAVEHYKNNVFHL